MDSRAVARKLPVKGTPYTLDEVALDPDTCPESLARWCKCTWDSIGIGLNVTHPGAQPFYDSILELYAEWGVDFVKWDCMWDDYGGYSGEELLAVNAVRSSKRDTVLSLSPGGGMTTAGAGAIPKAQLASMFRVTGDFHAGNAAVVSQPSLGEAAFVIGNLTQTVGENGRGSTWFDLDMLDLGEASAFHGKPEAQVRGGRRPSVSSPCNASCLRLQSTLLALRPHPISALPAASVCPRRDGMRAQPLTFCIPTASANTIPAQLHAALWTLARSPLMMAGAVPTDATTLNLLTNPLAMEIHAHSSGLNVSCAAPAEPLRAVLRLPGVWLTLLLVCCRLFC